MRAYEVLAWRRRPSTPNGNPRFWFVVRDEGTNEVSEGLTKPDAAFLYALPPSPTRLRAALRSVRGSMQMTDATAIKE